MYRMQMFLRPDFYYLVLNSHFFAFKSQSTSLKHLMKCTAEKQKAQTMEVRKRVDKKPKLFATTSFFNMFKSESNMFCHFYYRFL